MRTCELIDVSKASTEYAPFASSIVNIGAFMQQLPEDSAPPLVSTGEKPLHGWRQSLKYRAVDGLTIEWQRVQMVLP